MVADLLDPRLLTPTIVTTVALSGVLAGTGVARRPAYERVHPVTAWTVLLVAVLVTVLVSALVAGLRDYITRLGEHTRELEESRARLAVAAVEARRSIERDLHDGAQQRLATIAVDLGRANRMFDQDPPQARTIVHDLQGQLEAAIRELRDLAHGIYPPLLGERGLVGALPAAGRRTTLPCTVDVRSLGRHSPSVEAAVYFCCTEAIHNADRHSGGSLITVRAERRRGAGPRAAVQHHRRRARVRPRGGPLGPRPHRHARPHPGRRRRAADHLRPGPGHHGRGALRTGHPAAPLTRVAHRGARWRPVVPAPPPVRMGAPARLSDPSGTVEAVTVAGDGARPPGAWSTSIAPWAVGRTDGVRPTAVGTPSLSPLGWVARRESASTRAASNLGTHPARARLTRDRAVRHGIRAPHHEESS